MLEVFAEAGANPAILYEHRPHIGTDVLREVIVNIRHKILSLGGEVRFGTRLESLQTEEGRLTGAVLVNDEGNREEVPVTDALILAIGHSARDTFEMIHERKNCRWSRNRSPSEFEWNTRRP